MHILPGARSALPPPHLRPVSRAPPGSGPSTARHLWPLWAGSSLPVSAWAPCLGLSSYSQGLSRGTASVLGSLRPGRLADTGPWETADPTLAPPLPRTQPPARQRICGTR